MFLNRSHTLIFFQVYKSNMYTTKRRYLHLSCYLYVRKPALTRKKSLSQGPTVSGVFHPKESSPSTNINFYGVEGDEGVIYAENSTKSSKLILDSVNAHQQPKSEFRAVSFGAIRLDAENKPSYYARHCNANVYFSPKNHISSDLSQNVEVNETTIDTDNTDIVKFSSLEDSSSSRVQSESSLKNMKIGHYDKEHTEKTFSSANKTCNFIDNIDFSSQTNSLDTKNEENLNQRFIMKNSPSDNLNMISKKLCQEEHLTNPGQNSFTIEEKSVSFYFPEQNTNDSFKDNEKSDINFIENQYFNEVGSFSSDDSFKDNVNFIDEQYFKEIDSFANKNSDLDSKNKTLQPEFLVKKTNITTNKNNLNYSKQFDIEQNKQNVLHKTANVFEHSNNLSRNNYSNKSKAKCDENELAFETKILPLSSELGHPKRANVVMPKQKVDVTSKKTKDSERNSVHSFNKSTVSEKDHPETAYDFVNKLRESKTISNEIKKGISPKKEKKLDSKGFRILKHQVPSLIYFTRDEILTLLKESILYSDDDIVVLNKPYNLVIHESKTTKDSVCLSSYLGDLAKLIDQEKNSPELFTVHRLDKETTGCLLLARNEVAASRIKALFSQRMIIKTYWVVTSKVPDPMEGVIDIPISEGKIKDKSRMVLHPDLPKDIPYANNSKSGKRAVTQYSVIAVSGNAALVEVKPETGIKHQIRVHFGFGLGCPILGDHKYSHLSKLAPQKLPSDLLQKLCVRQSKVRYIPLHIHSKHILIPQYSDERNLFVTAPLPRHMSENLRTLKFRKN